MNTTIEPVQCPENTRADFSDISRGESDFPQMAALIDACKETDGVESSTTVEGHGDHLSALGKLQYRDRHAVC